MDKQYSQALSDMNPKWWCEPRDGSGLHGGFVMSLGRKVERIRSGMIKDWHCLESCCVGERHSEAVRFPKSGPSTISKMSFKLEIQTGSGLKSIMPSRAYGDMGNKLAETHLWEETLKWEGKTSRWSVASQNFGWKPSAKHGDVFVCYCKETSGVGRRRAWGRAGNPAKPQILDCSHLVMPERK